MCTVIARMSTVRKFRQDIPVARQRLAPAAELFAFEFVQVGEQMRDDLPHVSHSLTLAMTERNLGNAVRYAECEA